MKLVNAILAVFALSACGEDQAMRVCQHFSDELTAKCGNVALASDGVESCTMGFEQINNCSDGVADDFERLMSCVVDARDCSFWESVGPGDSGTREITTAVEGCLSVIRNPDTINECLGE